MALALRILMVLTTPRQCFVRNIGTIIGGAGDPVRPHHGGGNAPRRGRVKEVASLGNGSQGKLDARVDASARYAALGEY
jgi:hypothetical protein